MPRSAIDRIREIISPRTFYEELAQAGELRGYLLDRQRDKFAGDPDFRREMIALMYEYSDEPVPEVEAYFLEQLAASFGFFLEYTKPWREKDH
ncbi:MAG: hypothetical protein ACLFQX_06855 [Candidatus Kapaibacterium sp.]